MRHSRWLTAILALNLAGCVLRGKQQAKLPAVPPPPQPAARAQNTSAARPEPLSIPQTQAQLPPFQPVDPQALATVQPPAPPVETQPPKRPPRPTVGHVPAPAITRPEPPAAAATAATPVTAPPPAPVESEARGQVQEILPPEELKHLQDSLAARKLEVHRVLDPALARKLNSQQAAAISRIQSFLQSSDEAEKRGDLRQADALGERAQILAREFQGGGR
jgi:hypothetical protein